MSLPTELGLKGQQANIALTIFFVPYVLLEIPSNILMKKFNPHVWLSSCILAFGVIMLCQGFVNSYGGLLATRFFLGVTEAGIFPGSFYLISFWYKYEEAQKRFTLYWSSVILAGAFGGLLATGIANMNGVRGLSNWRWIFILEGIITILIGIAAYFLVSDFPKEAKWLNSEEREFVLAKTHTDESHDVQIGMRDIKNFLKDIKNWLGAVIYFSIVVPIYAFAYFTPTLVQTLGYSVVQTQLHSVPPFAAALGLCFVAAYISDKARIRLPFVLLGYVLLIIGLAILLTIHSTVGSSFSTKYAAICLVSMGAFGAGPSIICWFLMNLRGHKQRSIGSAWMISIGNTGGIVATFAFLKQDAPEYHTGYSILMAISVLGTVSALLYAALIARERGRARDEDADSTFRLSL
jgi:MFS family permease